MAKLGWEGRGTYIPASTPYSGKTLTKATTTANKMANPWAGKSIEEIRQMEYARNPQMKPLEPTQLPQTSNATETERAKALAYLKEYVGQMRAAGFPDYNIAQKLMKTKVIQIPNNLPENFGRMGTWASGMANEINVRSNIEPQTLEGKIPSPNEYLEYMPGYIPNRLPTYEELMGLTSSTGKFSQIRTENLRKALQNYVANYRGETVSPSQYAYEAGIVGLPQDIGQQYYQGYIALKQKEAEEAQKQQEYEDLVLQYPQVRFVPGASTQENAAKIKEYHEAQQNLEEVQQKFESEIKAAQDLVDEWNKAKSDEYGVPLFEPIQIDENTSIDPFEKIIEGIRAGFDINEISDWIIKNNIPITNYQLQGLYYLYG